MRALLALLLLLGSASPASAGPDRASITRPSRASASTHRPIGTRPAKTAPQAKRLAIGDVVQAPIRRPSSHVRASRAKARRELAGVMKAQPSRKLDSLLPGYESYRAIQARARKLAKRPGVRVFAKTLPNRLRVQRIVVPARHPEPLRVLVIGGVHSGTEVVGTESAMQIAELAARQPEIYGRFEITVVPLANPAGLILGSRRNAEDQDVNRSMQTGKWTPEGKHLRSLGQRGRYHVVLDLHGAGADGRDGFFAIRGDRDRGMAERFLRAMPSQALVDVPDAKGQRTAKLGPYTFDALGSATSSTAGTVKSYMARLSHYSYTLEAPTRLDPDRQVRGMVKLVRSALSNLAAHGHFDRRAEAGAPAALEP